MILNAEHILEFMPDGLGEYGKKAQVGIDLSIQEIRKIIGGKLYKNGTKEIDPYEDVDCCIEPGDSKSESAETWILEPGIYSLTFDQKVKLDSKHTAFIRHKSSLLRIGAMITSGLFDPGFTSQIGATMIVFNKNIEIQKGATLAQLVIVENEEAEEYNGNYQGDKDLK